MPQLLTAPLLKNLPSDLLEDVLQETFIRIFRHVRSYQLAFGAPRAWLRTIAVNAMVDLWRAESRHHRSRVVNDDPRPLSEPVDQRQCVSWDRAHEYVEAALARTASPQHRQVIRLRLNGMPQKEVAQKLNLPPNTVGVIFSRFRSRVGNLIDRG
jgi:RNA polymerase sigma-70 factor (ECF subfamily)